MSSLYSCLCIFFLKKKIPLLTTFLWFQNATERKIQLLNATKLINLFRCSLCHILSSIKWNTFQFSLHIMLFHVSGLCLCHFFGCNTFLSLTDFCQYISNHNFYWTASLPSTRLSSGVNCPRRLLRPPSMPRWLSGFL